MKTPAILSIPLKTRTSILIDGMALAFIYFVPTLSHLFSIPVYMIEPMRLMMILSLAHSSKINTYLLALTLPAFSFLVSGHPMFGKMLIISGELALNVFLYYYLSGKIKNVFFPVILSIILSKLTAYLCYLIFFPFAFVQEESDISFLGIQLLTTLIFSTYVYQVVNPAKSRLKKESL